MSQNPDRPTLETAQLLVIDVQERLVPHIHEAARVVDQCVRMMRAAAAMSIPITITEQYPQGLGHTIAPLLEAAPQAPRPAKLAFSVCGDETCRGQLESLRRPCVVVAGIETHVCVQQTVLDLLETGQRAVVLADAVSSRRPLDHTLALELMRGAGAMVTSVESVIYQLMRRSGTDLFRKVLSIVK